MNRFVIAISPVSWRDVSIGLQSNLCAESASVALRQAQRHNRCCGAGQAHDFFAMTGFIRPVAK
jgi:hypothetical protein